MNITVNILELASELAHKDLVNQWGETRGGMYKDENAEVLEYCEEAQDLFNDLYDEYETLILSTKTN